MTAFDTDVLTDALMGAPNVTARIAGIPVMDQCVPSIVIEEILRGRLDMIRRAESGKAKVTIDVAYHLFEETLIALRSLQLLSYTTAAEALFQNWRETKVRGSTHDLRIAATAVAHSATLVTRNRRDFEHVPGLSLEVWA
jgi:tRNA(fMet)-specific endonuclease VapC